MLYIHPLFIFLTFFIISFDRDNVLEALSVEVSPFVSSLRLNDSHNIVLNFHSTQRCLIDLGSLLLGNKIDVLLLRALNLADASWCPFLQLRSPALGFDRSLSTAFPDRIQLTVSSSRQM